MKAAVAALAVILFTGEVTVLILRSGHKIPVAGAVRVDKGAAVFRHASGVLYSLPLIEVDVEATEVANGMISTPDVQPAPAAETREPRKLAVTPEQKEKLLRELEKSRGTPTPPRSLPPVESLVSDEVEVRERDDEEYWRSEAGRLQENLRRRREDVETLKRRVQRLEDEIRTLLGFGTPPDQYGGNVMQLEDARAMLEDAQLEVARAERERGDFHERARRLGILPGWLR